MCHGRLWFRVNSLISSACCFILFICIRCDLDVFIYTLFAAFNQQCFSLIPNQHQPAATSQPAVLFSHNKSAPVTSHNTANRVINDKINAASMRVSIVVCALTWSDVFSARSWGDDRVKSYDPILGTCSAPCFWISSLAVRAIVIPSETRMPSQTHQTGNRFF